MRNREHDFQIVKPYGEKLKVETVNDQPSLTKQSFAEELDANNIIKRFGPQNIEAAYKFEAIYGEFTSYDLREAIDKVEKSAELFQDVPADLRIKFNNDPGKFIDFVTDENNLDTLREHGLAKAIEVQEESLGAKLDKINETLSSGAN